MRFFILALISLAFATIPAPLHAEEKFRVVELFTSQHCPGCPPADRIFKALAQDSTLIALGCHVTYFDRGEWRDDFSKIFCDARQGAYRQSGVAQQMYTPQMIVNGTATAVGSHGNEVKAALEEAQKLPLINLALQDGMLDIRLPALSLRNDAEVWLFGFGRDVNYANPVMHLAKLLSWDGRPGSMTLPLENYPAQQYAVIVQYADRDIIAAGRVSR
ncbi:MAG: DUF1223 domain-containing protein [Alphaproteobacteria bacterium]|nr:DUF1223 domain-containing protein [Alphaproteobacteria bacterium]